jgi:GNAT superfamily N-acetyltransferase
LSKIVEDLSPPPLIEAIETNMFDFWLQFGRSPQVELYDGPDMIRLICNIPSPFCNNVLRAQLTYDDIDSRIEETLSHFKSRGLPIRWMTSPSTRPVNLGDYLEAHGLNYVADYPGMAIHLVELNEDLTAPSDLRIEYVEDVKTLEQFVRVFIIGYGVPVSFGDLLFNIFSTLGFNLPLRHYIGLLKGEPVACSSLLLSSGVAGIYLVATVQEARGQGIGSALTLAPLCEARALGYRIGILGSTEKGLGVYRRLGFREYFKFGIYISSSETIQDAEKTLCA